MIIEVNNLSKKFGDLELFTNLSFVIPHGKMTCLFGKSGIGKTTLLNILGGIEQYQSGEILYNGKKLTKKIKNKYLQNEFGFVFQNFGLLENETVYDNFMIIRKLKKMKKIERDNLIANSLREVDLANKENQKVFTLSGGEQQRVALAKIIAKDCNMVFADEPLASLDKENRNMVIGLMKSFNDRGKTIVVVSHDEDLKNLSDEVIHLGKEET